MNFTITKHKKTDYILSIKGIGSRKEILLESIIHQLSFAFIDEELFFKAETVCILSDFIKNMNYEKCINLINSIRKQIEYLSKYYFAFIGFDLQDIIVVNESIFIIASIQYLYPVVNDKILFYIPFKKPYFSSPELIELTELPGYITVKSYYYAIGALVVYCLLEEYLLKGNDIKSDLELEIILKPIYLTKMYWFLKRSLKLLEKDRQLLII